MSAIHGSLRVVSATADAGQPPAGQWLPERDHVFPIADDTTTLGRGLHNAIVLFDPTVSREHACLRYSAGSWSLENCSTTSPVKIGNVTVPEGMTYSLTPGQRFTLGMTELQLVAPDLPPSLMALRDSDAPDASASIALLRPGLSLRRALGNQLAGWNQVALVALGVGFLVAFVLVAVGLSALITGRAVSGGGANLLAALMLPLVPAAGVAGLITLIDRYEREPWYLLLGAFLWGAIIAIPPALFIEANVSRWISSLPLVALPGLWADLTHSLLFGLNAGLTEEIVKDAGLLVLLFIFSAKFENVTDGILYGAIIGAGFAMIENIVYFSSSDLSRHAIVYLIIGRVILGWFGHSTFTACFGAGLGFARERRGELHIWRLPLIGFGVGVLLHTFFDFVDFQANLAVRSAPGSPVVNILALAAVILDYAPLFAAQFALYIILMRSLAREAGILREYLVDEVRTGVITPEEYLVLQRASVRQRLERFLLIGHGVKFWLAVRTLYATMVSLAFTKWHMTLPAKNILPPAESPVTLRMRMRSLRHAMARYDASAHRTTSTTLTGEQRFGSR